MESKTLLELAELIGAEVVGNFDVRRLKRKYSWKTPSPAKSASFSNPKYEKHLATTKASAVIIDQKTPAENLYAPAGQNPRWRIRRGDGRPAWPGRTHLHTGVHPKANVDPTANIGL